MFSTVFRQMPGLSQSLLIRNNVVPACRWISTSDVNADSMVKGQPHGQSKGAAAASADKLNNGTSLKHKKNFRFVRIGTRRYEEMMLRRPGSGYF